MAHDHPLDPIMLHVHCSNRFEVLAELLAERVRQGHQNPFAPEHIIVPSAAIRRAISLHLADRYGISANLHFAFPAEWLWARVASVVPGVQSESPYAARRLGWRLYRILSAPAAVAESAHTEDRLANYLGRCDDLMRRDLAMRLGALFEQYTTYRPDWLAHWERGHCILPAQASGPARADERWQARLWQALQAEIAAPCADPIAAFLETLSALTPAQWRAAGHPSRVQLVAPTGLPPLHARLLAALGQVMDIHLLVINPCQEYWFDLVNARQLSHLRRRGQATGLEQGHPLLVAWGQQTQAHLAVLIEAFGDHMSDDGGYLPSGQPSLLASLQNSLLNLEPPQAGGWSLTPGDQSIEIHACHSLGRQLEALQERLLAMFSQPANPPLAPSDVLVVVPDLRAAAPLIEAIFGTVPDERQLPYSISGLPELDTQTTARSLLEILAFVSGRADVQALAELLRHEGIRKKFELDPSELDLIETWLMQASVHWGLDARHRAAFAGSELNGHTVAQGLERLFLAYALPDAPGGAFQGLWPAGQVQGQDSLTLGKLWRVFSVLSELSARLASPLTPSAWKALLDDLFANCLEVPAADIDDLLSVRAACAALFKDLGTLDASSTLSASVFIRSLQEALETPLRGAVPSGAITFAAPGSLRHLPFRVIAVLGLDDGVFPSASTPLEFDLMAHAPRVGDRQRREDDRGIFLDLVLAAREKLLLGSSAFSIRDNAPLPPSILLSELTDTLRFALGDEAYRSLMIAHPLQAFDLRAFMPGTDERLRSHDIQTARAWQHALPRLQSGQAPDGPAPLVLAPSHPAPPSGSLTVSLTDLIASLCNPARALLMARARLSLKPPTERLKDQEPLVADRRHLNRFKRQAAQRLAEHWPAQALIDQGLQAPGVPAGWLGIQTVTEALQSTCLHADRLRQARQGPSLPDHPVDHIIQVNNQSVRLVGTLSSLWAGGQILALESSRRPEALLTGWVLHLVLCLEAPAGIEPHTQVHTLEAVHGWRPHPQPLETLSDLVALHLQILREPVPFFPRSSLAIATEKENDFISSWAPRFAGQSGESEYPEVQRVWRGQPDPTLLDSFRPLAFQVYSELLTHHQDLARV